MTAPVEMTVCCCAGAFAPGGGGGITGVGGVRSGPMGTWARKGATIRHTRNANVHKVSLCTMTHLNEEGTKKYRRIVTAV
jgi:hypothetical protein